MLRSMSHEVVIKSCQDKYCIETYGLILFLLKDKIAGVAAVNLSLYSNIGSLPVDTNVVIGANSA